MRRREFITILGGAAITSPIVARAQQAVPVVGYLGAGTPEGYAHRVAVFRKGLGEAGFVEGRNVAVEYRWAENQNDRLADLAADLVRRRVAVIVTPGSSAAALAAKAATAGIPIVFSGGFDPVETGLAASFNRPGGNATGFITMTTDVAAKRLELLHELAPRVTRFAALLDPRAATSQAYFRELGSAAAALQREIEFFPVNTNREVDSAFASLRQKRCDALWIGPGSLFVSRRAQIVTAAAHNAIPAVYPVRDFVEIGGLASYGANQFDQYRQVGLYAGRILKSEKPAELPVVRADKFELVINLHTAKLLGLTVPPQLLIRADEVIE